MSYLITGWGGRIRTSAWRNQNPLAPPLLQGRCAVFVLLCLSRQTGADGGWAASSQTSSAGEAAVGGEATIAPIAANLFGEASVKREAPPGQWLQGCCGPPLPPHN